MKPRTPLHARLSCQVLALAILALYSCPAPAALTTFTGTDFGAGPASPRPNSNAAAAAFDAAAAAIGGSHVITFEGLSTGEFTSKVVAPGLTVTLTGTDEGGGISNYNDVITGYNTTSGGSEFLRVVPIRYIGTASAEFSFSNPIAGFGAYLTGVGTASGTLHVLFNDGSSEDTFIGGSMTGGVQFFGFLTPSQPITSLTLQLRDVTGDARDIFGVDDVRRVCAAGGPTPPDVPEPATLAIFALGGLVLARTRRAAPRK